jgi:hypothetical protein
MTRQGMGRQHIKNAVYQNTDDFTDLDAKRFLQAYTGTFPTNHKLWLMNRHDTGDCNHCKGVKEHMVHWQSLCPHYHDSRQAVHNMIVTDFHTQLKNHAGKDWTLVSETPIGASRFRSDPSYRNWQPDGLAFNPHTKELILLELTRCNDSRHSSNLDAVERKQLKYEELLRDLQAHNNQWTISLHTTAIGFLTTTKESELTALLHRLNIAFPKHQDILRNLIRTTAQGFAKMARERATAQHDAPKFSPTSTSSRR